jgi:hypothetical protein
MVQQTNFEDLSYQKFTLKFYFYNIPLIILLILYLKANLSNIKLKVFHLYIMEIMRIIILVYF